MGKIILSIKPDECTSLRCIPPNQHCWECSHALFYGEVMCLGRSHRFEFSPQFGATFLTANGDVRKVQPSENHPLWEKFEEWRNNKFDSDSQS